MEDRVPARLSAAEGRKFGLTVGAAFMVLGAIVLWRAGGPVATALLGLGGALVGLGLTVPGHLGPLQRAWMGLAHLLSRVTTPIFLGIVYFIVITPIGLLMAAAGKRPLRARRDAQSYWRVRVETDRRSDLTRQF